MIRRSERVSFTGGSGFELAGIIDQPETDPIASIVFTHCFTCSKDLKAIVRISRGLAHHGFAVLRYDLTGLGGSRGEFANTNFSTNRADLLAAIDYLSQELTAPSFLIGHSFGGACSLSLTQQIESVRGVVALAAPSDTGHLAELLVKMNPAIEREGVGSVRIGGQEFSIGRTMLEDFRQFDLPAELRKLSKPSLILHSPVDETLAYEHALRLFSLLTQRGPNDAEPSLSSLITLPNSDHLLVRNPADLTFITDTIAAWCKRILN